MTLQEFPQVKRPLDVAVISDLHLGMRGCRAAEVLAYLRSIDPEILVLNGDIGLDGGRRSRSFFGRGFHLLFGGRSLSLLFGDLLSRGSFLLNVFESLFTVERKFRECRRLVVFFLRRLEMFL